MSVIGPRPGLWNQDILTAERDKYNANDVKPGLTGCIIAGRAFYRKYSEYDFTIPGGNFVSNYMESESALVENMVIIMRRTRAVISAGTISQKRSTARLVIRQPYSR